MRYRKHRDRLVAQHLNWQDIFGCKHLTCPNPDSHVNGDHHPSAFVYPDGIFCFGCGWRTTNLVNACKIYFGWLPKKTKRWAYSHMATHPPRPEKIKQTKPIHQSIVGSWMENMSLQDVNYICNRYGVNHNILAAAMIGCIGGRAFTIPHQGLDGRVWAVKFRRDDRHNTSEPKYWSFEGRGYSYIYPAFAVHHYMKQDTPRSIVLCEGEFDCLAALSHDISAIAVPSGSATNLAQWGWFWEWVEKEGITLYLGYDLDDAGEGAVQKAFKYFWANHPDLMVIRLEWEGEHDIAAQYAKGGTIL